VCPSIAKFGPGSCEKTIELARPLARQFFYRTLPWQKWANGKKGPNIESKKKIMKMEEIKQVVKSRYGKFADTGLAKQESC
jgi:hypothetical protein